MHPPSHQDYHETPAASRSPVIQPSQGFTLIELLAAIAITVIVATWAIPNYQQFTARNQVAAEVMRLKSALAMTRSAAIARRTQVTLCPSLTLEHCDMAAGWSNSLAIFVGNGSAGNAELLRTFGESKLPSLTYRNDNRPVRYGTLGRAGGHFGTFRICGKLNQGASVTVNILGRVRSNSGQPKTCQGD
ncbi:GspH/FimT family pseudopilin [Franzmannia qiaohouensis]|uniref:Type II secretion system protein H n=1 Tax=Franzmannia qiaohouensis TaxID=1329370 RepID=A0ABU1HIN8_9GAMM|nr:GspH/FimT family pseudopilin [Halomonas qiaohouensis]MDR5907152.1 GspH/FimT family pseudopilin [Halomonas qiaohouensis]